MKKTTDKNNNLLYIIGASVIGVGIWQVTKKKKNQDIPQGNDETVTPTTPTPKPTTTTAQLNKNLLLKKGVLGKEVRELQRLLAVSQDGSFGPNTENALVKKKNVKQITLNTFTNVANVNQSALPAGSNIMAGVNGATVMKSLRAADGLFYLTNEVLVKVNFGIKIGKITGMTADKQHYLVDYDGWISTVKVFVKATEVTKI